MIRGSISGRKSYKPEEIYSEARRIPPDLIVYFGNLSWRSVGSIGLGSILTFENDTGPDDANHDTHGIFIMKGQGRQGERSAGWAESSGCRSDRPFPDGNRSSRGYGRQSDSIEGG